VENNSEFIPISGVSIHFCHCSFAPTVRKYHANGEDEDNERGGQRKDIWPEHRIRIPESDSAIDVVLRFVVLLKGVSRRRCKRNTKLETKKIILRAQNGENADDVAKHK
jgi:hypothetical protein